MNSFRITVLPGDGVGPEVTNQGIKVLKALETKFSHLNFEIQSLPVGGQGIDLCGMPVPPETLVACEEADAILLGAVGGPKWDYLPNKQRPEQSLLTLRSHVVGAFANVRPVTLSTSLSDLSCLKRENLSEGIDLVLIRDMSAGIFFGKPSGREVRNGETIAYDTMVFYQKEVERIARLGFKLARTRRKKLTSVDQANVLENSRLWREVVSEVSKDYPDVTVEHLYVDNCAFGLIKKPGSFDVIITEGMLGGILSDVAGGSVGSIGMLASASVGSSRKGLFEPIHGSAPRIAGQDKANPLGTIRATAFMLEYSFGLINEAKFIEKAIEDTLQEGWGTYDIAKDMKKLISTSQMGDLIVEKIIQNNM
ncbi:3-isopropylmalate dehydrogenase [Bacillus sp. 1P10SD]|uniref:3-isopropylmalate dehydrogenase n=1 Tax=Bacillus sp. 1P10SD TaxID=3132265 RepID=UPI0039A47002